MSKEPLGEKRKGNMEMKRYIILFLRRIFRMRKYYVEHHFESGIISSVEVKEKVLKWMLNLMGRDRNGITKYRELT